MIRFVPRDSMIGLLVGPAVWMAAFVIIYGIVGTACALGLGDAGISGGNTVRLLALLVAALSAVVILLTGLHAWQNWQHARRTTVDTRELPERQRNEFLNFSAFILALLSFVGTAWMGLAILMNPIC